MTIEELRVIHVPDGCRLYNVLDELDEGGPIVKVYKRINTPEQEARVRAANQYVVNQLYTRYCIRKMQEDVLAQDG